MMDIYQAIGTVGFPIVMTLWFMFRTEKIIQENTKAMEALKDAVAMLQIGRTKTI